MAYFSGTNRVRDTEGIRPVGRTETDIAFDENHVQVNTALTPGTAAEPTGSQHGGAVSPGPGPTDGLESGTDGLRKKGESTTNNYSMGRRGYTPASTMLQGSRKLG